MYDFTQAFQVYSSFVSHLITIDYKMSFLITSHFGGRIRWLSRREFEGVTEFQTRKYI